MEKHETKKVTGADRWSRLAGKLQEYVDQGMFPGFISLVYRGDHLVHGHCCGMMDIQAGAPARVDAIHRIYSMTKPVTAAALMMLFEEGKLTSLDEPLSHYLPAFTDMQVYAGQDHNGVKVVPAERQITIRQLLTHTAGLGYGILTGPVEDMFRQANILGRWGVPDMSLAEMVQEVSRLPLAFQPGTRWSYSIGLDVAGHLVSLLSGVPFEAFLEERVFDPLGMSDTGFFAGPGKLDRLAPLYAWKDKRLFPIDAGADSAFAGQPPAAMGGGGLVSTAADYARFARMLLHGGCLDGTRILGSRTAALIMTNHLPPALLPWGFEGEAPALGQGYGLGGSVLVDNAQAGSLASPGTYSWGGAASTSMFIDPRADLAAVLMTQTLGLASDPLPPVGETWQRLVYQALDEAETRIPPNSRLS